ncbi:hypothetical protein AMELA_G00242490, partial [Ameiurus melas]
LELWSGRRRTLASNLFHPNPPLKKILPPTTLKVDCVCSRCTERVRRYDVYGVIWNKDLCVF